MEILCPQKFIHKKTQGAEKRVKNEKNVEKNVKKEKNREDRKRYKKKAMRKKKKIGETDNEHSDFWNRKMF